MANRFYGDLLGPRGASQASLDGHYMVQQNFGQHQPPAYLMHPSQQTRLSGADADVQPASCSVSDGEGPLLCDSVEESGKNDNEEQTTESEAESVQQQVGGTTSLGFSGIRKIHSPGLGYMLGPGGSGDVSVGITGQPPPDPPSFAPSPQTVPNSRLQPAPPNRGFKIKFSLGPGIGRSKGPAVVSDAGRGLNSSTWGIGGEKGMGKVKGQEGSGVSPGGLDGLRIGQNGGGQSVAAEPAGDARKDDSSCTDTDEDGELIQRAMKAKEELLKRQKDPKSVAPKKRSRGGGHRPGGISLKLLIEEGILKSGEGVLTLEYRGLHEKADLQHDGRIHWKEKTFDSPSAFSIFIKRLVNPTRKADDGWKTVKFEGKYLDHYKLELAKRRIGADPPQSTSPSTPPQPSPPVFHNSQENPLKRLRPDTQPTPVSMPVHRTAIADQQDCGGPFDRGSMGQMPEGVCKESGPDGMLDSRIDASGGSRLGGSGGKEDESLVHTGMFVGDAALLQPSLLGGGDVS